MAAPPEYDQVFRTVVQWPPDQRASLARALIDTLRPPSREKPTLDQIVGIAHGNGDEQVEQWLGEHRMQKYGR